MKTGWYRIRIIETVIILLIAWIGVGLLPRSGHADVRTLSDIAITQAVERALLNSEEVAAHRVDVITTQGIVTLSGAVDNLLGKRRSRELAQTIKGVRSVVNRIAVVPPPRKDERIEKDVRGALFYDPATESHEVKVVVKEGVVVLTGSVDSFQEKQLSAEVASGVRGVKEIKNDILVDSGKNRSDHDIRQDVKRRLETSVWIDAGMINVQVDKGKVTLSGLAGSAAEKELAASLAWVEGVRGVENGNLEVRWWLRDRMRRTEQQGNLTDDEIERAVRDAFFYDPRVASFNPEVDVVNGVAILTGAVSDLKAKRAAEEDARNTVGVWRIKNYLRVRPKGKLRDQKVAESARQALLRDPYVNRFDINLTVINGHAYLYGFVDSSFERTHAEDIVSRAKGVVNVRNYLEVRNVWTYRDDWEIQEDIKDELAWSPYIESEQVKVSVVGGVVTLTGIVDTGYERLLATEEAFQGGAKEVVNELKVKFGPAFNRG